jgi:glycosyltransferase involved in cell wall biosynthesis
MAKAPDHRLTEAARRWQRGNVVRFAPLRVRFLRMPHTPRVTAFIPAFNREEYICTAIDSLLAQQYTDLEILVVDDGSTDGTAAAIEKFTDPRVRLVRNPRNLGIPATRNRGLELARGEFIALLDSDDYAYPQRIGRQVTFLDRHPEIVQVGSWCSHMDAKGLPLGGIRRQPTRPEDADARLLFHCSMINRTIMARAAVLREYGYDEAFPCCQDYDLHARMAVRHRMANLPEILVCGREHGGRITNQRRNLARDRKMAIQRRLLEDLDVNFTETDIAWHFNLTQPRGPNLPPASEYLTWAQSWLSMLQRANLVRQRYRPRTFSKALGAVWAAACWLNRDGFGRHWPIRILRSRLALGIPRNLRDQRPVAAFMRRRAGTEGSPGSQSIPGSGRP